MDRRSVRRLAIALLCGLAALALNSQFGSEESPLLIGRVITLPVAILLGPSLGAVSALLGGAALAPLTPQALTLLGLPAADDMPGRIVNSAFVPEFTPLPRIPSWEPVPGDCGMHPQESVQEREEAAAALANLFAAGYSDPQPAEQVSTFLERHGQCNLGLLHLSVGRFQEARDVFKRLSETEPRVGGGPRDPAIPIYLAHSQLLCGDRRGFRKTRQQIPRDHPLALLVGLMESHVELAEGNREAALAAIERAESSEFPWLLFGAAILYLRIGAWEEAEARLRRTIELDPAMRHARTALSWVLTQRGKGEEAAEVALKDVQLDYSSAFSHFALGLAMVARRSGTLE
jgi:tetratricopeptide (TPR) repeat protein